MTRRRTSLLWMLAFVALWAIIEAMAAHAHRRYSPYQVVWTRYGVHLLLMLAIWGWRQPANNLWRTRRPLLQLGRSLLMLGMPASWVMALGHGVDHDTLMAIFWVSPLLIVVLSALLLQEHPPLTLWIASAAACVGAELLSPPGPLPQAHLLVFPLGMAATFSLYVVMTRWLRDDGTRVNLFYTALGVFLALTPLMPRVWVTPEFHDLLLMVAIGLLGWLALFALDKFASSVPVSLGAPLTSLQLPIALAFSLSLGRHLAHWTELAGLVVVAGAAAGAWLLAPHLTLREAA